LCAVDFELTGLDPHTDQIIAFGAVPVHGGRVYPGQAASGLIRPTRELRAEVIRVHGIRAIDLAGAPALADGIAPLIELLTGRVVVFHSAGVDRPFLKGALRGQGLRMRGRVIDTEVLGRLWLHERDGHMPRRLGLGELAAALGLPVDRPHDALADALTTAQVFIALASHLGALHPQTVASLAKARHRLDAILMFQDHSQL
jgi:DNA polymerase-3 subunit epsilon